MDERPNDRMLERTLLFVTLSIGILWFPQLTGECGIVRP